MSKYFFLQDLYIYGIVYFYMFDKRGKIQIILSDYLIY